MRKRLQNPGVCTVVSDKTCRAAAPDARPTDEPDDDDPLFDGDVEAPWDDFGWDFDEEEPEPEHGDFWGEPEVTEDDG